MNRSIIRASRGMYSQMSRPGTLVGIGLYSPRMPEGASGFMSNMSRCGGPPARNTMMTALCDREMPACASGRSSWGSDRPAQSQAADLEEIAPGDSVAKPRSCSDPRS